MAYVALYRKWRPQNFDTLVGQSAVKTALTNALVSGRIAHAYLFSGPRGTGKTSTARILAKALNCEHGPTANPCGVCANCQRITEGSSMDVFEIDAASNRGIDEIKALREQLAFAPVNGKYKVYIIDEVHMLTTEAFNALLKSLEEPPAHVIFILATTDPHKIPATIHSRCQRYDFRRVTVEEITDHLAMVAEGSGIEADRDALRLIAIQAEGGMRDALSLLDQCGVMDKHVTTQAVREVLGIVGRETLRKLVGEIGRNDLTNALASVNLLLEHGKDPRQIVTELAEYLRAILLYKAAPTYSEIYLTDTEEAFKDNAPLFGQDRLMAAEERLHTAVWELKNSMRPRITLELCLFDLCREEGSTLAALAARVEKLERKLAGADIAIAVPKASAEAPQKAKAVPEQEALPKAQASVPKATVLAVASQPQPAVQPKAEPIQNQAVAKSKTEQVAPPKEEQAPVAPSGPEEFGGDYAQGEDYWKDALDYLVGEKKTALVSCAKNGRVFSFENNILTLAFKSKFFCDRITKADYKAMIEDALLKVARIPIRIACVEEGKAAKPVAKPKPAPAKEAVQPTYSELPSTLKKAKDMLGGTIEEIK
ncbi:MAG: DNA polymerase III subunit gamma/tau [Phascolarctobacterium sp.]|nr:DNA polymerase III subunit gamma/tau [Phascolarctobacterium sp.]